jgi:hypothetical protein
MREPAAHSVAGETIPGLAAAQGALKTSNRNRFRSWVLAAKTVFDLAPGKPRSELAKAYGKEGKPTFSLVLFLQCDFGPEGPMRLPVLVVVLLFLFSPARLPIAWGAAGQAPQETPKVGVTVWDTRHASAPVTAAALAGKQDWVALPQGKIAETFLGDAVLSNGRIVAVLRKQEAAVEVHGVGPDGVMARLRLRLLNTAGDPAVRLERVTLSENTKGSACLKASFKTAKGAEVAGQFRLKRGEVAVQVEPGNGAAKLRVDCPGRFVVLPDFFADDIMLDATKVSLESVELPSDSFVLHPTGQGHALALCVFENRQQDVKVTLAGAGTQRQVTGSEIAFEGKKVWVALLEAPGIWHSLELTAADTGKVMPLDWKMPFLAQWRFDFTRKGDLTDSWEMVLQEERGGYYLKPSWFGSGDEYLEPTRLRWNTVLGRYPYPCWLDPDRQAYLQPLKSPMVQFQGPVLVYPINRLPQTPLSAYTVVDVMRNTLGVGPCEHILDLEGQKAEYRGRATCGVRDTLNPIYASNQQKQRRADIDRTLDDGLIFVKHIRGRITDYIEFGHKMRQYLAEQRKVHPEHAAFLAEIDQLAKQIDERVAARAAKIQTPEVVARMNAEFRKNVLDYDGPDALDRCRAFTQALVVIGDNQDELSGECRWVAKTMRQRAGIHMALDPRAAPIGLEIRARTQAVMRNAAWHEAARH